MLHFGVVLAVPLAGFSLHFENFGSREFSVCAWSCGFLALRANGFLLKGNKSDSMWPSGGRMLVSVKRRRKSEVKGEIRFCQSWRTQVAGSKQCWTMTWLLSHLFGFLHSITGRIFDLWRWLGVDFIIELKQTKKRKKAIQNLVTEHWRLSFINKVKMMKATLKFIIL